MSCPVKNTLTSYLKKEKIIDENNKVLIGSEELFDSLEVLNNYAKNEFGVEGNILKLKNITENRLEYKQCNAFSIYDSDTKYWILDSGQYTEASYPIPH